MNLEVYKNKNDISKYLRTRIGKRFMIISDGNYGFVGLFDKLFPENSIMTNANYEKIGCVELIEKAKGSVLIGGLGIGLIVLPLMNKLEVEFIDIVELHKEVIDLVAPQLQLNEKVKIINDNIFTFEPIHKYDTIFIDTIDSHLCTKDEKLARDEITNDSDLIKKYKTYLNDGGFCDYFRRIT